MYNKELENAPYKIWISKVDEDAKPISVEAYDREYKTMAGAWRTATKLCAEMGRDYRFRVAKRNPWDRYEHICTCTRCGAEFVEVENVDGYYSTDCCRLHYYDGEHYRNYVHAVLCPECVRKTIEFLNIKED